MVRLQFRCAIAANILLLVASGAARAQGDTAAATDSSPGSAILPGLGLSPQAPPVPPAPGGRAPSFGAPSEKSAATFRFGGRFFGYEAVGIGRAPSNPPPGYSGTALHVPMLSQGKLPFWGGAGATINASYGTPTLSAFVTYYFQANGKEYQSYNGPQQGPGFGATYLSINPDRIGAVRLSFKIGNFVEVYGGPGQWGWGIFGPLLALRGLGYGASGEWDVTRDLRLSLTQGFMVVSGVPEDFPRGDYNSWLETGVSSWLHHAHLGLDYKNQYHLKLHYASDHGTDDRTHLKNSLGQMSYPDGRFDTYLAEFGWDGAPWGHVGVTGGLYDLHQATAVADGVWWTTDWTQGAQDMIKKYLGVGSNGTGKVLVVGAEWDFSISTMLWHPRSFTGNAPDIGVKIAGMITRTLQTDDPLFKNATGYYFGIEGEYKMTEHLSSFLKVYGESRDANMVVPFYPAGSDTPSLAYPNQRWSAYSINPGIAYRTNWLSTDRIELYYGRRFYSSAVDNNSAKPLDHHMVALGGYVTF
jgi:hypothetical protein